MTPRELMSGGRRRGGVLDGTGYELRKESETEIYRERLGEIEIAFRYNLALLSDRDTELDALEEHLRRGIAQLERLSHEKNVCEELLERLDRERRNEIRILKDELLSREKLIRDLQRESEGHAFAFKEKLEGIRSEMRAKSEKEKVKLEKKYLTVVGIIKAEHAKEMKMLSLEYAKRMDEVVTPAALVQMKKEKDDSGWVPAESGLLEKYPSRSGKVKMDGKEETARTCCARRSEELNKIYERMREDMENIMWRIDKRAGVDKGTATDFGKRETSTQTRAVDEGAKDYDMMAEQNEVLKNIIKTLKRDKARHESETSRRFENEINDLKKQLEMEKLKRSEEEAIIYNLEASVVCLKEKLMSSLGRNGSDPTDEAVRAPEEAAPGSSRGKSQRRKKISR